MVSSISGATNVDENGVYGWEKSVTDVNNIDETFGNARDLGYTSLNYARITTVAKLGEYNNKDMYKVQVQSNGKLTISLRNQGNDENVLDLSEYEKALAELKKQTDPEGYAAEQAEKKEKEKNAGLLDNEAPGMYIKIYTVKNGKEVLIGDSTADKDSEEYQTMEAILGGDYKAKKGNYYIEVGKTEDADSKEDYPYAMQILQGTNYKHDYVMTQADSADTKNKEISSKPDVALSATTTYGTTMISAAYAAQIQAVSNEGAANMLMAGATNLSNITSQYQNTLTASLFSALIK